jgi:hypothetical protein
MTAPIDALQPAPRRVQWCRGFGERLSLWQFTKNPSWVLIVGAAGTMFAEVRRDGEDE